MTGLLARWRERRERKRAEAHFWATIEARKAMYHQRRDELIAAGMPPRGAIKLARAEFPDLWGGGVDEQG